jgi:UDP-glucose 4-epimerase
MMELALRDGARLCDVSTSEVYGGGRGGACSESDPRMISATVTARLEYAVAKLAAETAIINTCQMRDLWAVVIRPFNVAGPRQSEIGGFVLPRFAKQALAGQPITVYGDGTQVRAFTHAADVADGLVRAVRGGARGRVYNLGCATNRTTILELARLVLRIAGGSSSIVHVDPHDLHGSRFAEAGDKYPDGDLATRELGWTPRHDLPRIVREVVNDARDHRAAQGNPKNQEEGTP